MRMPKSRSILLLGVLLAACSDLSSPAGATYNYGVITLAGFPASGGQVTATPTGAFFRADNVSLPDSRATGDVCQVLGIGPGGGNPSLRIIAGGDSVGLDIAGAQFYMKPTVIQGAEQYRIPGVSSVVYQSGAKARITTVGSEAGFPAVVDSIITAEAFTVQPIPVELNNSVDGITLTWTAPTFASSRMQFSLRYGTTGAQAADQEILCLLDDDGSFTLGSVYARPYVNSAPELRLNKAVRYRTRVREVSGGFLTLVSSFALEDIPNADPAPAGAVAR
jgi:hypothetical protein